jgi:hypothetical protein
MPDQTNDPPAPRSLPASAKSELNLREEIDCDVNEKDKGVTRRMNIRSDRYQTGGVDIDVSGDEPVATRWGQQQERKPNLVEENEATEALAAARSAASGIRFRPVPKENDDSDIPDTWLEAIDLAAGHPDFRIPVQITQLDAAVRGELGARQQFHRAGGVDDIVAAIRTAIAFKQNVDPTVPPKTILLLVCPHPLPNELQPGILDSLALKQANPEAFCG